MSCDLTDRHQEQDVPSVQSPLQNPGDLFSQPQEQDVPSLQPQLQNPGISTPNYKGVYKVKDGFIASISHPFRKSPLKYGPFENSVEAAMRHDQAALIYQGPKAKLNFGSAKEKLLEYVDKETDTYVPMRKKAKRQREDKDKEQSETIELTIELTEEPEVFELNTHFFELLNWYQGIISKATESENSGGNWTYVIEKYMMEWIED